MWIKTLFPLDKRLIAFPLEVKEVLPNRNQQSQPTLQPCEGTLLHAWAKLVSQHRGFAVPSTHNNVTPIAPTLNSNTKCNSTACKYVYCKWSGDGRGMRQHCLSPMSTQTSKEREVEIWRTTKWYRAAVGPAQHSDWCDRSSKLNQSIHKLTIIHNLRDCEMRQRTFNQCFRMVR